MSISDIVLIGTQRRVAESVVEAISGPTENLVVAVLGIGGVGKSTVLNAIRDFAEDIGVTVHDEWHYVQYNPENPELKGGIVMPSRPIDTYIDFDDLRRDLPVVNLVPIVLKGMMEDETFAYVGGRDNLSPLSIEDIAKYSLGIPDLANISLDSRSITSDDAIRLAARRIVSNLGESDDISYYLSEEASLRYLQMPIPPEILEAIPTINLHKFLNIDELVEQISRNKNRLERDGILQESPFFVAPESMEIYSRMLENVYGTLFSNQILILAPNVNEEELERLKEVLGVDLYGTWSRDKVRLDISVPRQHLFRQPGWDKTYVEIRDTSGNQHLSKGERFWPDVTDEIERKYRERELPIKPRDGKSGIFLLNRYNYLRDNRIDTLKFGWMVESLMQHLEIPYIVQNGMLHQSYTYVPQERRIQTINL